MKTADIIYDKVAHLPELTQREVLDYVNYLTRKSKQEDAVWSVCSLAAALHGLENEAWPEYLEKDLKEKWV